MLDPSFRFPEAVVGKDVDVWMPSELGNSDYHHRGLYILEVAVRLAPGVSALF